MRQKLPSKKEMQRHVTGLEERLVVLEGLMAALAKKHGELFVGPDDMKLETGDFFVISQDEVTGVVTVTPTSAPSGEEAA